ncbi:hypothetical protein ACFQX7_17865 [Luedemannella flava]
MTELDTLLDEVFVGQERLTRDELQRHALASGVGSETAMAIDGLPEGSTRSTRCRRRSPRRAGCRPRPTGASRPCSSTT